MFLELKNTTFSLLSMKFGLFKTLIDNTFNMSNQLTWGISNR